ncbi:MAG TPA: aspartate aminotransferase family protein [Acidimicrobiales bacterium]
MDDELLTRHRAVLPSWLALYYEHPIELVSGEGCYVVDSDGNRYLDMFGGILTTMVGHGVPEIVDAIRDQAGRLAHASTLYLSEPMVELAEQIAELSGIPDAKVFFTTSGTEANDAALLIATTHRRSNQVLALRNSYHGRSFSAMAITGNRSWSASSFSGLAVSYVHGGYRLRSPFRGLDDAAYTAACVQDLRDVIDTTTAGDVACMIAEPIQGVGGFATPPDGFFGAMKAVLDEHGILFVSDEVQTGWGRTGDHFWGYQAHGVVPDILTFAKGVANGLPLGGVVARAEIMDSVRASSISTFGGNPVSIAAARATLRYVLEHDLQGNARKVGHLLRERLGAVVARTPWIAELRGRGLMLALETVRPGGIEPDPQAAGALLEAARERGVLIGKGGLYGNVLRIAPPLSLSETEAEAGAAALTNAIEAVSAAAS